VQFLNRDDFQAHEARVCIAEGYVLGDSRRPKIYTEEQYFKTQDEMVTLFADLPEALENTLEVARRCNIEMTLGKNFLPDFPIPEGMTIDEFLVDEAKKGLEVRLAELYPDPEVRLQRRPEYDERLVFECNTIRPDGLPRLLPDRGRLHQLGQEQRCAGRAGPGFRCRFAGRLQPAHHRP
jgi:DNA polymerase III subunit alpha